MVLGLHQRAPREFQVSGKVRGPKPAEALGDRPRRTPCGAADLFAEIEIMRRRLRRQKCVDPPFQLVRQLPALELSIVSCDHVVRLSTRRAGPRTRNLDPSRPPRSVRLKPDATTTTE